MFNATTIEEARRLKESIYDEYQDVANEAMVILDEGFEDSITIMALPSKYRIALRTSNIIERETERSEDEKRSFRFSLIRNLLYD